MPTTREQILLAAFTGLESAHFYSAFLPSVMTIRKFATDAQALAALRQGEMIATGATILLGWIVAELAQSPWPMIFAAGVAVAMLAVYEFAIRTGALEEVQP
jgi:hypothetical protein